MSADTRTSTRLNSLSLTPARTQKIVQLLLLIAFLLISILSASDLTATFDEPFHYQYGQQVLEGNTDRIDDSSMPVLALNALPVHISAFLPAGPAKAILGNSFLARLVTIIFSATIASLVFRWSRALYGFPAAAFSMLLYVLDPNILAHSQQITTDIYATGMITLGFYLLWRFANSRKMLDGLLCAAALGLSQLVKYTAVALFPLMLAALMAHDVPSVVAGWRASGPPAAWRYIRQWFLYMAAAALISLVIINAGFLFNRTFTPLKDYEFKSDVFQAIQAKAPWLGNVPMPVPYPYLEGLDWMRHTDRTADRYGIIYLLGRYSRPEGIPGYYFAASALKVPIATQVFILSALALFLLQPRRRRAGLANEVFLLTPFVFFTIYLNFFFNAQTGIRYYLVVFPMLYVFAGSLFREWDAAPLAWRLSSAALVVYLAVSVLSYFPHYMPYFNEFVWDKRQTYKYLADSNLEWGQSRGELARYLAAHPEAIYEPEDIRPGVIVVSGTDLVGILNGPWAFAWLRENFEPVDTVAYAYFVFDISPGQIAQLCATTEYCK